jgi:4-amino-4-deoxy-L-arabinose transferase-like glycosyltransferase
MARTQDFIGKRVYFQNAFFDNPQAATLAPPLVSYQVLLAWKLLGENIWAPRLFNVLFGILSIIIIYFLSLRLFSNAYLSLFSALLLSIMPLAVFFSRNLQPESPALFFMGLGTLFYLQFHSNIKKYYLSLGSLCFAISGIYKINFLIGIFPFIFFLPYRQLLKQRKLLASYALYFFAPFLLLAAVFFWLKLAGFPQAPAAEKIRLWEIFSSAYWRTYGSTIWLYIKEENFTLVFGILALLGGMLAFLRSASLSDRYIIGWICAIIPYGMLFSAQISQQSFVQMPFLLLICASCTLALSFAAETLKRIFKLDLLIFMVLIIAGISVPFIHTSLQRMYGAVFLGVDVAGESLRELTLPQERVFLLAHAQGMGISRYAQRYVGWSNNLEEFKKQENKFNIRFICIYPVNFLESLSRDAAALFKYIEENYQVKEVGFLDSPRQVVYIILQRGKGGDLKAELKSISGVMKLRTIYKLFNRYIFFYSVRPEVNKSPS